MLDGSVSGLGQLDGILARLRQVENIDFAPLARTLETILFEGNRDGLLAGLDATGRPFAELAEKTRKYRQGDGPPGVPDFTGSPFISDFRATVQITATGLSIDAGWVGNTATKARYFSQGSSTRPARPLQGIRPATRQRIDDAIREFARKVVAL